jgi:glycerol-3-phosphate dehydrogenase
VGRLDPVTDRVFDLLVVGGGINGAGIARDAAMRGLSVCLLDKNDWGWATSAKSSMLAHGGLRYLEQFELGLVHEALQDREHMFRQAPHLVRPLRFLYPVYPHVANRRTVRVGMWLYDLLSHGKSVKGRDWHDVGEVLRLAPGLTPRGLKGAASYTDGQISSVPRLVAELIGDAKAHGATCLNHAHVESLIIEDEAGPDGQIGRYARGADVTCDGERGQVRARAVINAAGTWVDDVLGPLSLGRPAKVRKTKGIHVVVPRFIDIALIIRASDGRTFFILPWHEHCLIGTTDTDYEGDAGGAAADAADVAYLLESARAYFPDAPLDEIRYTYAGVRALVNQEGLTESNVTRRHILYDHAKKDGIGALWSLQGGKITTYRALAEEAVDRIATALGRQDLARLHPTRTGTLPGGPLVPWEKFRPEAIAAARDAGLDPRAAAHVVDTYGARWRHVIASDVPGHRGIERIDDALPDVWGEVGYAVREEDARTLADVMLRRTMIGLAEGGRMAVARGVAAEMAKLLGWPAAHTKEQIQDYARAVLVYDVPLER